jgi:hypothetical protein
MSPRMACLGISTVFVDLERCLVVVVLLCIAREFRQVCLGRQLVETKVQVVLPPTLVGSKSFRWCIKDAR